MDNAATRGQPLEGDDLRDRTLRALAVAELRRAESDLAQSISVKTREHSEQLRTQDFAWGIALREAVGSLAKQEFAAGRSPVQMVRLMHQVIDEAGLERRIKKHVEPDVILWAIEAYFAA